MTILYISFQSNNGATNNSSANLAPSSTRSFEDFQTLTDAPDFTLTTMEGEPFSISEHKGKVIVLNIWATWCPPCREEIPEFVEMQDEMRDDGVLFVGVSMDESGWDVVRPFANDYNVNYPLVVDDGTVSANYGPFPGLPTTFIINKEGQVEHAAPGMVTKAMLEPILQELATR